MEYTNMTLSEYVNYWLVTFKKTTVKAPTYNRLVGSLTTLREYAISDMKICEIYPQHIQQYLNELVLDNYSISTIKKQLCIVAAPLRHAASEGIIPRDPTTTIKLPRRDTIPHKSRDVSAYTSEEQACLKKALASLPPYKAAMIEVLLETGMRVGEAIALEWSDINWMRKSISIRKTIVNPMNVSKSYVQNGAKSATSNRTIPMSTRCCNILQTLKGNNSSHVFIDSVGNRISYQSLMKAMKRACLIAGIEYRGMHVLRHTFATNCYYRGCDVKILSKLLGHATPAITYAIYVNLYGDALEEMRSVVG